ncbi:hypothetical protein [Rhizobium leguminosarum]|jgi:hypothetical protein|nr:hypothetical protein [Rhizobium leguminosarum]
MDQQLNQARAVVNRFCAHCSNDLGSALTSLSDAHRDLLAIKA